MAADPPFEVVTMGRIGVDIYPLQTGVPLPRVETFGKFLGGSPTNVAVAAARLGRSAAVVTRTGRDPFGDYCHAALRDFGVDDRWVGEVPEYPTPVTFCEIFPPDHFPLYFYRRPVAPDLVIRPGELDLPALAAARVFWMTGTGLCAEPSRAATLAALAARGRGGGGGSGDGGASRVATVFDLDWRPMFWPDGSAEAARGVYREALAYATVAVGNVEECEVATGEREPRACAEALLAAGVELAVVKQGPRGVLAVHRDGRVAEVPPHPVAVVNGLGAGDAFGGALCHGLLAGWEPGRIMRYANAAGALVASRLACSAAMPHPAEVEALLAGGPPPAVPASPRQPAAAEPARQAGQAGHDTKAVTVSGPWRTGERGEPRVRIDVAELAAVRARRPEAIAEAAARRGRRPLIGDGNRLLIIAADHPARGALSVGGRALAMADRLDLLERLVLALSRPGVDGVLATADVLEDLLLLGALEGRIAIGSMNRGGLAGAAFELDDRFTGHRPEDIERLGFDAGKLMLRIDHSDPGSLRTLAATARAIDEMARRRLPVFVEPFLARRVDGRVTNDRSAAAVATAVSIASGLGGTSAYTWLKVPVTDDAGQMAAGLAASTLPAVLLGGEVAGPGHGEGGIFSRWREALRLPTVQGLVAGRTLLYPPDGDVAAAVDAAAALLRGA